MRNENLEGKRWWIAVAAIIIQLCLGNVYAWSVFKNPLMAAHGWGETATQAAFIICVCTSSLACAFGGILVDRKGPRFVATIGGVLFGGGTIISGLADQIGSLLLLYASFGLIAGLGNGFCYLTPIATLIRWFPDKRGLVTGLAVMGTGAGAFFMGKIAPGMILSIGVQKTFYFWGTLFLVLMVCAAQLYRNPPEGWLPAGFNPGAASASTRGSYSFNEALRTPQWWMLWTMLFLNVTAGIGLISQLSPLAQDVIKTANPGISPGELAVAGGAVLAYASIFNGLGRLFWAWISDAIGRKYVFLIMFLSQAVLYIILPNVGSQVFFTIISCYLLSCYGGGFATMPAFAADSFGPGHIGKVYGTMLTGWAAAGAIGPLIFAQMKDISLFVAAGFLFAGLLIAFKFRLPARKR